jgi:hypothetical protein
MPAVMKGITESGSGSVRVDPWDKQFHAVERGEIVKLYVILSASEESQFLHYVQDKLRLSPQDDITSRYAYVSSVGLHHHVA